MATPRVPLRLWLLVVAGCVVAALLDSLQAQLKGWPWQNVFFQGAEWLFLGALTPLAYYLGQRMPLRSPRLARSLAMHTLGAALLCLGWAIMGVLLRRGLGNNEEPFRQDLLNWILTSVPWSFFMYFTMVGCVHAFSYYLEAREREAQAARLSGQLAEARLSALRMQLHPHFLFNSLNAITVLVRDQRTQLATRMLEQLSDVLRQVLRSDQSHEVALSDELQLIEQYLVIEQVRFSDRLRVRFSVDDAVLGAAVPRFILQPLVENALRHGVSDRSSMVTLTIGAAQRGQDLELWVRDEGPGISQARRAHGGVGLENTRLRLNTMYGERASVTLSSAEGGGAIARIVLPFRTFGAAAGSDETSHGSDHV